MTVPPPPNEPPQYGPPPPGSPPPFPAPDPERKPPAVSVWLVVVGVLLIVPMSFVLIFMMDGVTSTGALAGIFAGLVFVGGGGLCFVRSPQARGLGIGLMVGWAVLSITTGGICTGLQRLVL